MNLAPDHVLKPLCHIGQPCAAAQQTATAEEASLGCLAVERKTVMRLD